MKLRTGLSVADIKTEDKVNVTRGGIYMTGERYPRAGGQWGGEGRKKKPQAVVEGGRTVPLAHVDVYV